MEIENLYQWMRAALAAGGVARPEDEGGAVTLEQVLWIGGIATIALVAIAAIGAKVTTATNNIPTGP